MALAKNGVEEGQAMGGEEEGDDDEEDGPQRLFIGWMQVDKLCFRSNGLVPPPHLLFNVLWRKKEPTTRKKHLAGLAQS